MSLICFDDTFATNIDSIDTQHKTLFDMINTLHQAMKEGKSTAVLSDIIADLKQYTVNHFSQEEIYFKQFNYPDYLTHKIAHDNFTAKVIQVETEYKNGKMCLSMEIIDFLTDWLTNHIKSIDMKYSQFLIENGVK